ncbi:MAG: DNA polymerase III subunit delta [Elusimicrobia bacterium CG06_land_8_20_14_3_00_38_11]|nr:MAG: DNA polymerase III subunit delta [Elusimicrobia bacterium CG06_land_8_20_14_3_00_38_11]
MPALKYYELKSKLKTLKKSDVSPVYLFYGIEDYLKDESVNRLENILIEPDMHDLNYSVFHIPSKNEKQFESPPGITEKNVILENALSSCDSLPFISAKKMVVIKNIHKLLESQDELLKKYIEKPHRSCCLVLVGGDKLPKREVFRKIEKLYPTVNFYNLKDDQIYSWIIEYAKAFDKIISMYGAEEILKITGNNLYDIKNEVDKLILYAGDKTEIEMHSIEVCCGHFRENTVFELMPALSEKKTETAIKILANLFNSGEDEYMILAQVADRYRKYLRFNELIESGVDDREAALRSGVKFYQDKFISDARKLNISELKLSLTKILETDMKMKSGGNNKNHLERLFFDLCQTH